MATVGQKKTGEALRLKRGLLIRQAVTVNRNPEECFQFCRRPEYLLAFVKHLVFFAVFP